MARTPVVILTGFLGAGKTTLLSKAIASERMQNTAILINEFGEIAIDHHLIREIKGDAVLLGGGCACCVAHGDFVTKLVELYSQAARGEGPRYDRIVIETSGASDPTPLITALATHRVLASVFELAAVITIVDAPRAATNAQQHPEAAIQIAVADYLFVSKADLVDDAAYRDAQQTMAASNPLAELVADPSHVATLLETTTAAPLNLVRKLSAAQTMQPSVHGSIRSQSVRFGGAVRPGPLSMWLSIMTQMHGEQLVRIKGIVAMAMSGQGQGQSQTSKPMQINCVGHLVFPALELSQFPDGTNENQVVFIARGMSEQALKGLVANFVDTLSSDS